MRRASMMTVLIATLLVSHASSRADVPAPACRHHVMTTPGYTAPPSRFDPPWVLGDAERAAINGAWISCDGRRFEHGGTCAGAVRERWDVDGGLCERTIGARTELAFCHATSAGPGLVDIALVPEHGGTVVHLTGTSRRLRRR